MWTFPQDWTAIKTRLEPLIIQFALEERERLMIFRKRAINIAYEKYKCDFLPPKLQRIPISTLPPLSGLGLYEPIKNLLNLPSGTEKFEQRVNSCVEDFLNAWSHLVVPELASVYSSLYTPQNTVDVPSLKNLNIFMAASVFLCIPCTRAHKADSTFFGWAAAVGHKIVCRSRRESPPSESDFAISFEGHEAVLALIRNLGLDPRNTSPRELDTHQPRLKFLCVNCEERWVFGWRGMVLSFSFSFVPAYYTRHRLNIIWMSIRSQHPCGSFCLPKMSSA